MKKKLVSLLLTICTALSIFSGCSNKPEYNSNSEQTTINIACMKGPTGIGMIKLISDSEEGKTTNKYNYSIVGTADEIATKLIKGSSRNHSF